MLRRKFLRISVFSGENYTISDAPRCRQRYSVSSRTAKKSAQRGLTASNEQFAAEGGQWFRQNTMHYLNFKSPWKCRLNSLVSFSLHLRLRAVENRGKATNEILTRASTRAYVHMCTMRSYLRGNFLSFSIFEIINYNN